MGVAGSGKTTLGRKLAASLACPFFDADDHHSRENREKLSRGQPLTDQDREPWLKGLGDSIRRWNKDQPLTVLACSALKQKYRDLLSGSGPTSWVYLKGDKGLIGQRILARQGHFVDPAILESQFADLEEPREAIQVDIREDPDKMTERVMRALKSRT